jgi:hypothetical protein
MRKPTHKRNVGRFWSKVDQAGGLDSCWLYLGSTELKHPYGLFWLNGRQRVASNVAYEFATGKALAPGDIVMHSCDTPRCCNPEHLSCSTVIGNIEDMVAKGRQKGCVGSAKPTAKLTEDDVVIVRELYVPRHPEFSYVALAKKLGVSPDTIRKAVSGKHWAHV